MNENKCAIPWFMIARQAVRGMSLETLSVRYHVSVADIRSHLDKAVVSSANGEMYVRTNAEINQASQRVRNDLVSILMEAIDELSVSQQPRLAELDKFEKLLASAARLFQWPTMQATRYLHASPVEAYGGGAKPTDAVNLALIATTPEQLARLAKEKFSDESQVKSLGAENADSK